MRRLLLLLPVLIACGPKDDTLCKRYFEPYPDMVGQRERNAQNAALLDAMAAYDRKDYVTAATGLKAIIDKNENDYTARMYLVSALLGSGDPYKAEMHLDYLENAKLRNYNDQVDWYNTLCWLCEGQYEKALREAQWIAGRPAHTYKKNAEDLVATLMDH